MTKDTNEDNPLLETIARLSQSTHPQEIAITPTEQPTEVVNAALVPLVAVGAKHRRSIENLLPPWQPGQSGNPKGRPPSEISATSKLKDKLSAVNPKTGKTYLVEMVDSWVANAIKTGNPQLIKEILDRTDGKVKDTLDMRTESVSILYEMVKPKEDKEDTH